MTHFFELFLKASSQAAEASKNSYFFLIKELTSFHWPNYLFILILISLIVWGLEMGLPWRRQKIFRQDFFLDAFYMIFNFFLAPIFFLCAIYAFSHALWQSFVGDIPSLTISHWPYFFQVLTLFLVQDFFQYWIHRLLHVSPWLWNFHRVHHSVVEMGFAAHLRYHWMENVVYRSLTFLPLTILTGSLEPSYHIYVITVLIGHLNHANLKWDYGPLKVILNHPTMHLWHHARERFTGHPSGVNFGISLSCWDIIFGTAHMEKPDADLGLGFDHIEKFPKTFRGQNLNLTGPKFDRD